MVFILFELFAVHTTYYSVIDAAKQTSFIWKVCDFFGVVFFVVVGLPLDSIATRTPVPTTHAATSVLKEKHKLSTSILCHSESVILQ